MNFPQALPPSITVHCSCQEQQKWAWRAAHSFPKVILTSAGIYRNLESQAWTPNHSNHSRFLSLLFLDGCLTKLLHSWQGAVSSFLGEVCSKTCILIHCYHPFIYKKYYWIYKQVVHRQKTLPYTAKCFKREVSAGTHDRCTSTPNSTKFHSTPMAWNRANTKNTDLLGYRRGEAIETFISIF